ncbi:MAG: glycosyltransferase family 4 protein [Actinomycetota bacterium]|nr:glycosyltransferase family 4 protein [Actinomycetota bacterium]
MNSSRSPDPEPRTAFVVTPSLDNVGGVERSAHLIERVLHDRGWQVRMVAPTQPPSRWVRRLGGNALSQSRSALRQVPGEGVDLVVTPSEYGTFAPRDVPRVHVYHGTMVQHTIDGDVDLPARERARRVFGEGLAEALAGRGATSVAVSESAAREVRRYFRLSCDAVIPNGIDTDVFAPRDRSQARTRLGLDQDARYALFVGRTEARKGADLLVASCARAGFELIIAGTSTLDGGRELGVLGPDETAWAYAAADCVLFPSRYEACSYVVLEALASGTPLVTTRTGWMETFLRIMPAYRDLCVWPDVEDIAAQLRRLEDMDTERLTAPARAWMVEHGGFATFARRWDELLERVAPS